METREELLNMVKSSRVIINNVDIRDLLSAPTQEQLDCPYCHKGKHVYICENTYLEITPGETRVCKKRVIDYEEWQIGAVKFDYCPICGRNLGMSR